MEIPSLREILAGNPLYLDEAVDTVEAARIVGLAAASLETMRVRGNSPPFTKRGRRVLYTRRGLLEWLRAGERTSTSDPGPETAA